MKCFQHPIDTKVLKMKKRQIKKALLTNGEKRQHINIAVLGGSTTNEVTDQMELFLLHNGIEAKFYQSEYAQYWQDAIFGNTELDCFKPDIIYIHTSWRNINIFPTMEDTEEDISEMLETEYQHFEVMWKELDRKFNCPIIQNNFDRPNYRLMGNRDIWDIHGRSNYISRLNQKFYEYSFSKENFYINDIDYLSADYGLTEWNSALHWHMYKYAMNIDAIPIVACSIANIIKSLYGRNKKVLVLDMDNTLWGGIIGDDGIENIAIGPEVPYGQIYTEFQTYCKALKQIGVVLAVNSKNDETNALEGLNHPDGILCPEDFVSIKANWEPKDRNIHAIASELTLGVDAFVFVDDNPAERAIVSEQIPEVAVPDMNRVEDFINTLDHCGYFEVTALSAEDIKKTEMYHAKAEAIRASAAFSNYEEYLDSLQMKALIRRFEPIYIQRIAQLTNKSNQFNLTTLRCTEDDIRKMADNDNFICLYGKLTDRFGDNGVVSVVAGEQIGDCLHIRLWLMSCRVLKRGMEGAMMDTLVSDALERGVKNIIGYYYPTAKNTMVKDFYPSAGFLAVSVDDAGNSVWKLKLSAYQSQKPHIKIERTT